MTEAQLGAMSDRPMIDSAELARRLRHIAANKRHHRSMATDIWDHLDDTPEIEDKAAALIETQAREIAELRAALEPFAAGAPAPIDPADLERASYPTIDGRVGALERRCDAIAGRLAALERRQIAVGEAASPILVASSRVDWECAIRGLAAALEDDGR